MTGHQTWGCGWLQCCWKAVGRMQGSLGNWQSSWAHFLTCQNKHKTKVTVFKDGRRQWQSEAHSLHLFPAYHWLTHLTHLIQSDIYKKCPAVNQTVRMPIKFTAFFVGWSSERNRSWMPEWSSLKRFSENRSGGNLVPTITRLVS